MFGRFGRFYNLWLKKTDGMAVILKNNQPKYVIVDFSEYDKIATVLQMRKQLIDTTADAIKD